MKYLQLKNTAIPIIGFGTWQLKGDECYNAVKYALKIGYRHIDTAHVYGNHKEIGQAITDSKIPREDIFITSKVWREDLGYDQVRYSAQKALEELQTNYIDMYLIHWPNKDFPLFKTIQALHELLDENILMNIGVSNFTKHHIEDALQISNRISTNQVEFHPSFNQIDLLNYSVSNGIYLTAYSPLGQGKDLALDLILELSEKYHKTPSQIIINWIANKGIITIPKSTVESYIKDNLHSLDFELTAEDANKIDSLNTNNRMLNPPFAEFDY